MKKIFFIGIIFVMFAAVSYGGSIELSGKISTITVFSDSALVKKMIDIKVVRGENLFSIVNLPLMMDDASLKIRPIEDTGVKIKDIKIQKTFLNTGQNPRVDQLNKMLNELNDRISLLTNEKNVINSTLEYIKKANANQKLSIQELEGLINFNEKTMSAKLERLVYLDRELEKLELNRSSVLEEINLLKNRNKETKVVQLVIASEKGESLKMEVSYLVRGVSWVSSYEINANSTNEKIAIGHFVNIKQATGEDWTNVDIEVSTARPSSGRLPEIFPIYLEKYLPQFGYKKGGDFLEESVMSKANKSIAFIEPEIKEEATSFLFKVPYKVNIPSDNNFYRFQIAEKENKGEFFYYAIPKMEKSAFLKATVKNSFGYPLLQGNASIYLDGIYVAKVNLNKTMPDEEIEVSLGKDESIKVDRKQLKRFTEYVGFGNKNVKVSYEYIITIQNTKKNGIILNVKDQFPVSRDEMIKVNQIEPTKDRAIISDDGIISWNLSLSPKEKKELSVKYSVEYPKDYKVSGLE